MTRSGGRSGRNYARLFSSPGSRLFHAEPAGATLARSATGWPGRRRLSKWRPPRSRNGGRRQFGSPLIYVIDLHLAKGDLFGKLHGHGGAGINVEATAMRHESQGHAE